MFGPLQTACKTHCRQPVKLAATSGRMFILHKMEDSNFHMGDTLQPVSELFQTLTFYNRGVDPPKILRFPRHSSLR